MAEDALRGSSSRGWFRPAATTTDASCDAPGYESLVLLRDNRWASRIAFSGNMTASGMDVVAMEADVTTDDATTNAVLVFSAKAPAARTDMSAVI